ncbi:MAG: VOC family protein, partial [Candidatus Binatia bacterium]
GVNHIGFMVDSLESAKERLRQLSPDIKFETPDDGVSAAEYKLKDPAGNFLDISERGWKV